MILVFLNNKLVTADTIVPLMLEVKKAIPWRKISFYCADQTTYEILKKNMVLSDAIDSIGELTNLGSPSRSMMGRIKGSWAKLQMFARTLLVLACRSRIHLVHFRALNEFPFSFLAKLNWNRTVFMESTCWGYSKLMIEDVGNRHGTRRWTSKPPQGGVVVGFGREWPHFNNTNLDGRRTILMRSTHFAPAWLDFVSKSARRYLKPVLSANGWSPDSKIIVYILGTFGKLDFLRSSDTMKRLLFDTLDALQEHSSQFPVILKPHAITDRKALSEALADRPKSQFVVSDIHPMVLGQQALCFIANYVSLTFGDARALGVPTIEYSDYSDEILAITDGRSMREDMVTEFVNGDLPRFRDILQELVIRNEIVAQIPVATKSMSEAVTLFCE
jgi:hypothetical protein